MVSARSSRRGRITGVELVAVLPSCRCAAGAGGTPAPQRLGTGRSLLFTGEADTRRSLGS